MISQKRKEEDEQNKNYSLVKAPLTTTATLTGATEIIGMMLQNNSQDNVMKEKKKNNSLNRSFQMQILLSSMENVKNVLSYSTAMFKLCQITENH